MMRALIGCEAVLDEVLKEEDFLYHLFGFGR